MHFHKISKKVKPQFPIFKPIKQSKPNFKLISDL